MLEHRNSKALMNIISRRVTIMSLRVGREFKMTLKTRIFLKLHNFFYRLAQWFIEHADFVEVEYRPKWQRKKVFRPRARVHDVSKFMKKRSGKLASWYRKQIKRKVQPEVS